MEVPFTLRVEIYFINIRIPLLIVVSDLKTRRAERRNPSYPPNEYSGRVTN